MEVRTRERRPTSFKGRGGRRGGAERREGLAAFRREGRGGGDEWSREGRAEGEEQRITKRFPFLEVFITTPISFGMFQSLVHEIIISHEQGESPIVWCGKVMVHTKWMLNQVVWRQLL